MKNFIRAAVAAAVLASIALPSIAHTDLAPSAVAAGSAERVVVIADDTKNVNVFFNEVVLFKVGGKEFAVKFDGPATTYKLSAIAPAGFAAPTTTIYVTPNPTDRGMRFL